MKAWLFVGAKVTYVGDGHFGSAQNPHKLVKGEIYTIRGFYETAVRKILAVWLEERPPIAFYDGVEIGWAADNFRPVSAIDTTATVAQLARLTIPAGKVRV